MRHSPEMQLDSHATSMNGPNSTQSLPAMLLWDRQDCIPLRKVLLEDDMIVLLTPVVVPHSRLGDNGKDPFEPLGRAIASRHSLVRHVPYTKRGGITNIHFEFIKRAKAIVFVISGPPLDDDVSQIDLADTARTMADERPQIIVACCNLQAHDFHTDHFATMVQIAGYSPPELETAASIIFGDIRPPMGNAIPLQNLIIAPQIWPVEACGIDMAPIHQLWTECLPPKYHLSQHELVLLLQRDGFSRHYVVREPETKQIIGFCATYTTYPDGGQDNLLGSLAVLIVKNSCRGQGVGLSLHDHALRQLQRTRGVNRLQLGSTFPRLFYGVPSDFFSIEWFSRRGWQMNGVHSGQGIGASDWLLKFDDMLAKNYSSAGLTFRRCGMAEYYQVLDIVSRDAARKDNFGWYDQYFILDGTPHIEDILLGLEGDTIVAIALTYTPKSGSPVSGDLPWAKSIGADVGGVTCICIIDDHPEMVNSRDSVMTRLLDTCVKLLAEQGMRQMFIDGAKGGDAGFQSLGFREWAKYKDVWRKVGA
ncbi:Putative GNAT domain, acyl-CoA N-acyltransferase [Colletotrichum destructivum]|uniref:GNAT domain, acyl-CoA N-acyltransferase n=1 Tax=Colletotrichum destructivum TaxID=34406 RepID=A0AAX4I8Y1_9PEZI|nr:Putative GNAT domain, acyl-CoA N-acyltransferase [Colletotrichum destructivum]